MGGSPIPTGLVSVPEYPFWEQKEDFTFVSLLTRPEVITALSKVRAECNKVTAMSLFHSSLSKSSRLEEFEQIQSQTFSQVLGSGWAGAGPQQGPWGSMGCETMPISHHASAALLDPVGGQSGGPG